MAKRPRKKSVRSRTTPTRTRRTPRARRTARSRAGTRAAAVCRLREIEGTPDYEADTGATVRLFAHEHVGGVLIAKAEYGGKQLVPAGQALSRIELTVKANRNTLKLVLVFSASMMGRGELREDCGGGHSQFIRPLDGDEPLQLVRIIGR